MSMRFRAHPHASLPDPRLLRVRDRAILRIVNRSKAATSRHLTELLRAHPRKVQERALLLWRAGYLERTTLPPAHRGGSPLAYRLSTAARLRLGYRDRRTAGTNELQHRLDTTAAVSALARPYQASLYPMQAWLTESMARRELSHGVEPDSVVVLEHPAGSAVLCLEVDEGTQHLPTIRHKLLAYREALSQRLGWQVLFVAPSEARVAWLRRQARAMAELRGWEPGWAVELADLLRLGLAAPVHPLLGVDDPQSVASLLTDPASRACPTPVGSPHWLQLLGTGGGEDFGAALR
ncbi:MAG: replication-relaxation family protein [Chloroflexota bacterium]